MQGEDALHRDSKGVFAHGERLAYALAFALEAKALEVLYSLPIALDDPVADPYCIPRLELGDVRAHAVRLNRIVRDHIRLLSRLVFGSSKARSSLPASLREPVLGLPVPILALLRATLSRQARISAWLPDNSTAGTSSPSHAAGRVYFGGTRTSPP